MMSRKNDENLGSLPPPKKSIDKIELPVLQSFCSSIEEDVYDVITLEGSVKSRNHFGATSPEQVEAAARRALERIEERGKEDC